VEVLVEEATAFTLFGTVVTGEQVGVDDTCETNDQPSMAVAEDKRRIGLPMVG